MIKILIFAPLALENGRGGELSTIELASGLKNYYYIALVDTNKTYSKKLLSKKFIEERLRDIRRKRINFAMLSISNKHIAIPYPLDFFKLFKIINRNNVVYFSLSGIGMNLLFIIYYILSPRTKFIVGHRLPLYSKKRLSLYNIRLKISFILLSLFKKRLFHHTISFRRKKFLESFFEQDKIFHIRHCVEIDRYMQNNEKEYKRNKNNNLKFIYVGYLDSDDKGIDVLLDGIDKFLEAKVNLKIFFEFCGKGPLESDVIKLEKKYPQYVKFHGYISYEKIPEFYKRNDVFLFTSRREAFGRVIIEALAAELLILCTKTIGSNEILNGKEFAFFLNELTAREIQGKINEIYKFWIEKPKEVRALQISAKDYAFQKYDYSNELNGFLNMFKEIYPYK